MKTMARVRPQRLPATLREAISRVLEGGENSGTHPLVLQYLEMPAHGDLAETLLRCIYANPPDPYGPDGRLPTTPGPSQLPRFSSDPDPDREEFRASSRSTVDQIESRPSVAA